MTLQELLRLPLDPRAAFVLTRIDGTLRLEEVIDVAGMPKEAAPALVERPFLVGAPGLVGEHGIGKEGLTPSLDEAPKLEKKRPAARPQQNQKKPHAGAAE